MKIISYGHLEQKRLTCANCETIMEYDIRDINWTEEYPEEDVKIRRAFVVCPICKEPIEIRERGVKIYKGEKGAGNDRTQD